MFMESPCKAVENQMKNREHKKKDQNNFESKLKGIQNIHQFDYAIVPDPMGNVHRIACLMRF